MVQWWVEKLRKLRFSQFCIIFLYCVCFAALSASVIALKLQFTSLFLYDSRINEVSLLRQPNKWSVIKYFVRTQVSVHGNFIFERSTIFDCAQLTTLKFKNKLFITLFTVHYTIFHFLSWYLWFYQVIGNIIQRE